uniref:Secreted protein n=1 Tax=Oryza barthii TaxID=65489 RepID=A0A0D3H6M0_9ORYZ
MGWIRAFGCPAAAPPSAVAALLGVVAASITSSPRHRCREGRIDIPDTPQAPCRPRMHAVPSSSLLRSANVSGRESDKGG